MNTVSEETLIHEFNNSKEYIYNLTGKMPIIFIYPYNAHNLTTAKICKQFYTMCSGDGLEATNPRLVYKQTPNTNSLNQVNYIVSFTYGAIRRINVGTPYVNFTTWRNAIELSPTFKVLEYNFNNNINDSINNNSGVLYNSPLYYNNSFLFDYILNLNYSVHRNGSLNVITNINNQTFYKLKSYDYIKGSGLSSVLLINNSNNTNSYLIYVNNLSSNIFTNATLSSGTRITNTEANITLKPNAEVYIYNG
jgi:hypothetical protein